MIKEHEQLHFEIEQSTASSGEDSRSSPNVYYEPRTLIFKDGKVTVGEKELDIHYGQKIKVKTINKKDSAAYTMGYDDFLVAIKDVGVTRTITLPKPSLAGLGKLYVIKDASGSAASTTIAINPFSTETIDGDTATSLNANFQTKTFYCDGTNWLILHK